MRSVVFCLSHLAVAAVSLACRVALADATDAADAETLFRQGRASAEAGDYPRACVAFTESLRLDAAPGTLLNLADCEEHVGRLAGAMGHFLRLESVLPAADERHAIAHERAAALAVRVPWMTVTLAPHTPPDARVFRDGVEMRAPELAGPFPVDPGPHNVLVVARGYEATSTAVVATERATVRVAVSVGPVVPHEVARPAPSRTPVWLVGGAGVASLGVGTYFGARALAERSVSDAACAAGVCANATGLAAYQSARSDARVSDVAFGISIVGVAVAGYLLLTSGSDNHAATALRVTGGGVGGAW